MSRKAKDSYPNIILIMSDQHNPHVMGCSGNSEVQTPNLDRLAREGVRFNDTSCASPLCVPSRSAFMTGLYPSYTRVWTNSGILSSDTATFAHAFGAGGYEPVLCGRMDFTGPDKFHGFEKRIFGEVKKEFLSPLDKQERTNGQIASAVKSSGPGKTGYQEYDRAVTEKCCSWLGQQNKKSRDRPFALVVGFVLPHNPLRCPQDLYDYYMSVVKLPEVPEGYEKTLHPVMKQWWEKRRINTITKEDALRARACYYGLVTMLDRNVGRIIDALSKTQFKDNTIIVYTSDHGDMAGEHKMWWKSNFYQGSVGVPLIFSFPGKFLQGHICGSVTNLIDVGPTLLDLAGCPELPDIQGRSLRKFLTRTGTDSNWTEETFSEYYDEQCKRSGIMARNGNWKFIHYHGWQQVELYNLDEDPNEFHNLGQSQQYATMRKEFIRKIQQFWDGQEVQSQVARRNRHFDIIRKCPYPEVPHSVPDWKPPAGSNTLKGKDLGFLKKQGYYW
jgi:choline-sulfatase